MGNQSTSGIVEETKATNEVISSPDELKEENQTQVQEDKTGDCFQEKSEKDISEENVNEDYETTDVEPNLEEGRSKLKNEEQDEVVSCDSRGEKQNPNPECTSTITVILNSKPHEAATDDITSEYQEDQSMLEKEIEYLDVEEKENDLIAAGTPCDEGLVSEMHPDEAECEKNDDHLEEEKSDTFSTLNDDQIISLIESSAAEEVDQEISQFLTCSDDPSEMIIKENGEECAVEIDPHCGLEKDGVLDEVMEVVESDEEEVKEIGGSIAKEGDESILEKAVKEVMEIAGSTAVTNDQADDESILEKGVLKECIKNEHEESRENLGFESKTPIAELKKCPSFDFGVSFDKQMGESDQTPLLYQDKTARRSISSCSNLTKYLAIEVQEKTIRMERSNSESINKQETVLKDDASMVSERANAKRKPRSSLFSTCICCTAAIS